MVGKIVAAGSLIAVVILGGILQTTTPSTIGPLGILVVFVLMYISILGALTFLFYGGSRVVAWAARTLLVTRQPFEPLDIKRSYYFATVIALAPVMIVGMQSVGNVSGYDVFLVLVFVLIAVIYISKRTR